MSAATVCELFGCDLEPVHPGRCPDCGGPVPAVPSRVVQPPSLRAPLPGGWRGLLYIGRAS